MFDYITNETTYHVDGSPITKPPEDKWFVIKKYWDGEEAICDNGCPLCWDNMSCEDGIFKCWTKVCHFTESKSDYEKRKKYWIEKYHPELLKKNETDKIKTENV